MLVGDVGGLFYLALVRRVIQISGAADSLPLRSDEKYSSSAFQLRLGRASQPPELSAVSGVAAWNACMVD